MTEKKDEVAVLQFEEFRQDLNDCVKYLKGKRLDKPTKYKFKKKVKKVVARYFNQKLSDTREIVLEHKGNDLLIKYPFAGDYLTLMRFEIREQSK